MFCVTKNTIKSAVRRRRIQQFYILHFDFYTLKLTIGQFEYNINKSPPTQQAHLLTLIACPAGEIYSLGLWPRAHPKTLTPSQRLCHSQLRRRLRRGKPDEMRDTKYEIRGNFPCFPPRPVLTYRWKDPRQERNYQSCQKPIPGEAIHISYNSCGESAEYN